MQKNFAKIVLKSIAVAMGDAIVGMSTLKTLNINDGVVMLGLGLAARVCQLARIKKRFIVLPNFHGRGHVFQIRPVR